MTMIQKKSPYRFHDERCIGYANKDVQFDRVNNSSHYKICLIDSNIVDVLNNNIFYDCNFNNVEFNRLCKIEFYHCYFIDCKFPSITDLEFHKCILSGNTYKSIKDQKFFSCIFSADESDFKSLDSIPDGCIVI